MPVHSAMANMLENFANSCFPTDTDARFNIAIEEDFFWVRNMSVKRGIEARILGAFC